MVLINSIGIFDCTNFTLTMSRDNRKNLILCLDGTSNKFSHEITNVVKAYDFCMKDENQIVKYVPGVGSISDKGEYSYISRVLKKVAGLGFGFGLQEKVLDAYGFLIDNYDEGDCIYLFGFSRGSYTAKVLAGLIYTCGLLRKDDKHLMQYAYGLYSQRNFDYKLLLQFRRIFALQRPTIEFMGLWDSVSSVGNIVRMRNFPYTKNVKGVNIIRHAVAIDERRALFKRNATKSESDIEEVWFAGVHTDVGGGFLEEESGLSKIPLQWMMDAAMEAGAIVDNKKYEKYVTHVKDDKISKPDPLAVQHKNNFFAWLFLELLPRYTITSYSPKKIQWYWPLYSRRPIPEDAMIHDSVKERVLKSDYLPSNLPKVFLKSIGKE